MAADETRELSDYLKLHPDDNEKRWSLAKKQYLTGQYAPALDNLRLLREQWPYRINVRRYLAASYYRVGRYDEAVAELRDCVQEWEREIPLREQLARVLEVSGRTDEAVEVWKDIRRLRPDHAVASWAVARLEGGRSAAASGIAAGRLTPTGDTPIGDSDPGFELGAHGRECPNCGTQNSDEFERCWRCRAPLGEHGLSDPVRVRSRLKGDGPGRSVDSEAGFDAGHWPTLCRSYGWDYGFGIAAVVLFVWCLWLTRGEWPAYRTAKMVTPDDLQQAFRSLLLPSRMAMGGLLLIAWPVCLGGGLAFVRGEFGRLGRLAGAGISLASAMYLATWLDPSVFWIAWLAILALSAFPILLAVRFDVGPAIAAWLIQAILVVFIQGALIVATEGVVFLTQLPQTVSYISYHSAREQEAKAVGRELFVPVDTAFTMQTSGSAWVDGRFNRVSVEVSTEKPGILQVELLEDGESVFSEPMTKTSLSFDRRLDVERAYRLKVKGLENTPVRVVVRGVLVAN